MLAHSLRVGPTMGDESRQWSEVAGPVSLQAQQRVMEASVLTFLFSLVCGRNTWKVRAA